MGIYDDVYVNASQQDILQKLLDAASAANKDDDETRHSARTDLFYLKRLANQMGISGEAVEALISAGLLEENKRR